jgi:hypothetical protein
MHMTTSGILPIICLFTTLLRIRKTSKKENIRIEIIKNKKILQKIGDKKPYQEQPFDKNCALAAHGPETQADIPNFTDAVPIIQISEVIAI